MFHNLCVKLRFNFQRQLCKLLSEGKCVRVRAIKVAHRYLSAGNEVQALSPNLYLGFQEIKSSKTPRSHWNYVSYTAGPADVSVHPVMDSQPPGFRHTKLLLYASLNLLEMALFAFCKSSFSLIVLDNHVSSLLYVTFCSICLYLFLQLSIFLHQHLNQMYLTCTFEAACLLVFTAFAFTTICVSFDRCFRIWISPVTVLLSPVAGKHR